MRYLTIILIAFGCVFSSESIAQREYSTSSKKAIKYFEEALQYYSAKRNAEAIEILQKAIKADENFVEAYTVSGDCYADLGDFPNAIQSYQKVVDLAPDFLATSYKQLADVQFKTGDYESALGNYTIFMTKKRVNPQIRETAERYMKNAEFGAVLKKTPVPFDPKNLGEAV
ncbi:MAG: tetratricopeptide repeat protein, partial [Flavobacteriales bacterium]|nr:tetratricopeptide repeat protein [Flavobacteriales bacterium]